jgi:hypothetical protein
VSDLSLLLCTVLFKTQHQRPPTMSLFPDQGSQETILRPNSSSSRGRTTGLSYKASGLLAPGQLHHISSEHERNATVVANHVEYNIGTTPSASPAPLESKIMSESKDAWSRLPYRTTRWKCVGMIIGFLFPGQFIHACG